MMTSDCICGAIYCGDSIVPIYGDDITGGCSYIDPASGNEQLVYELLVPFPKACRFETAKELTENRNLLGVIFSRVHTYYIESRDRVVRVQNWDSKETVYNIDVYGEIIE